MIDSLQRLRSIISAIEKNPYVNVLSADEDLHPFDERSIHPEIRKCSLKLFDNGHYSQATFEACKYLDRRVKKASNLNAIGESLMMRAFQEKDPAIALNLLSNVSEVDEQRGYKFLFAGSVVAIRNPRGHEVNLPDSIDQCLDHLSFVSMLLRKIDEAIGAVV